MPLSWLQGAPGIFRLAGGRLLPVSSHGLPSVRRQFASKYPVFIRTLVTVDQGPP